MKRLLVTGSRTWDDITTIRHALVAYEQQHPGEEITLVSGACPNGADALAEKIAAELGWAIERHPADWSKGKSAGFARNREMVASKPDECVAFHRDNSRGTGHTINLCAKSGVPVMQYIYAPRVVNRQRY